MGPWMSGPMSGMPMSGMPMYLDGWAWLWMAALWLLPVVVLVAAIWAFARGGGARRADEILSERFARGEIDENELRARRAALRTR
ncbi:MAG TPA: SHOCT domain-containing protein [Candidatus Limnocylindria bacterium]|nr:SHOCT domain-containing protein [Candidatus Limnocylindria bacterium]